MVSNSRFMLACCALSPLLNIVFTPTWAEAKDIKGWSCVDGVWHQNGQASEWFCDSGKDESWGDKDENWGDKESGGKDANACSPTQLSGPEYHRTCVRGPPNNSIRCWWTYVPKSVKKGMKVPLVIGMHGGGGCASHQMEYSGFKELADSRQLIFVVPQGASPDGLGRPGRWNTCGSSIEKCKADDHGKEIIDWDDASFLKTLLATMIKKKEKTPWRGRINPKRIFVSGFSEGCMMSQRFAMEHSSIVAGITCHGGRLIGDNKSSVSKLVTPTHVYLTGGSADAWFEMDTFNTWKKLNSCNAGVTSEDISLTSVHGKGAGGERATLTKAKRCKGGALTARLEIAGAGHTVDARMPALAMDAMLSLLEGKQWRRTKTVLRNLGKPGNTIKCGSTWRKKRCDATDGCLYNKAGKTCEVGEE